MRLHVLLRNLGYGSRRKAEGLIVDGRVRVNDVVAHVGQQVEGHEKIEIDGHEVKRAGAQKGYHYLVVHKPVEYTTTNATHFTNETSVLELLPHELRIATQWQIVGRLDKNSEGLLLLTDHGELSYVLTHPKFELEKEYVVSVSRVLTKGELEQLIAGVQSDSGERYVFASINKKSENEYSVVLKEGKKREIREALGILGVRVVRLVRVRLGELLLGNLPVGEYREVTDSEKEYFTHLLASIGNTVAK